MQNRPSPVGDDRGGLPGIVRREPFENRPASAFGLAGVLLLASVVGPVALEPLTDWYWVSGILLAGVTPVAVAVGTLGLHSRVRDVAPRLSATAGVSATVAALAGLALVAMAGAGVFLEVALGVDAPRPRALFVALAVSTAGSLAFACLTAGAAGWRTATPSRSVGGLLVGGGVLLLVPVAGELSRSAFGVGTPPWTFLPVVVLVAIDLVAVGYRLRSET